MNAIVLSKKRILAAGVGFLFGVLWFVGMRFVLYAPEIVHYHANFAVFVNGQREAFESFAYYEEVAACSNEHEDNPASRVHMHQPDNDVVHVHDKAVTWGNFFENLRWAVGSDFLLTESALLTSDESHGLVFMLNGKLVPSIASTVIGSEDVLLVSYTDGTDDLGAQYEQIGATAGEFNQKDDPYSCAGDAHTSVGDRLKYAFGL